MSETEKRRGGVFGRMFGRTKPSQSAPGDDHNGEPSDEPVGQPPADTLHPDEARAAEATQAEPTGAASRTEPVEPEMASASDVRSEDTPQTSWLQRLTGGLSKTSSKLASGLASVFSSRRLDADTLQDLEDTLIQADLGVETTTRIASAIAKGRYDNGVTAEDAREILVAEVTKVLEPVAVPFEVDLSRKPHVVLVVGVNGAGKTTTIGKMGAQQKAAGRSVVMAAGDTFRAAAIDQLKVWGERVGCDVIARDVGSDASGLAYDALKHAQDTSADVLLIDTAGRLQNKQALMDELDKVIRVIRKLDATAPHSVLLVLDATTGQNALSQVSVFAERAGVTGLIMTKLDGTARGGILVAIAAKQGLPIHAIGVGEGLHDLAAFDPEEFARALAAA